jgi:hypothetical protein
LSDFEYGSKPKAARLHWLGKDQIVIHWRIDLFNYSDGNRRVRLRRGVFQCAVPQFLYRDDDS